MKKNPKSKLIFHLCLSLVVIVLIAILYISYITNHQENLYNDIAQNIQTNYQLTEDITYTNRYGHYYIITTPTKVIVLNQEYVEILKEDLTVLAENPDQLPLIYKTNKLMYEKTIIQNNKLTYEYYDAKTGDQIKTTTLERQ